jgi:hypothetical protein
MVGKRKFCSPECHLKDYHSNPERQRRRGKAVSAALQNLPLEVKVKRNRGISEGRKGMVFSEEHRTKLGEIAAYNWMGGSTGEDFAAVLCPAGFVREHRIHYGDYVVKTGFGPRRKIFNLDFAHVEGKINIELDGSRHKTTAEEDAVRDIILRGLGWRIIRIKHA